MADGSSRPIEDVTTGDLVLSADPETGRESSQRVLDTFVRVTEELLTIATADGRTIQTTADHPFWVDQRGFVEAKQLVPGDHLRQSGGAGTAVASVSERRVKVEVYLRSPTPTLTSQVDGWFITPTTHRGLIRE